MVSSKNNNLLYHYYWFDNELQLLGYSDNDIININNYLSNRKFVNYSFVKRLLNELEYSKFNFNKESVKSLVEFIKENKEYYEPLEETLSFSMDSKYVIYQLLKHYGEDFITEYNIKKYTPVINKIKILFKTKTDISNDKWFISFCNLMNYKCKKSGETYCLEPQVPAEANELVYNFNNGILYKAVSYNKGKKYLENGIKGDSANNQYENRIYCFSGKKQLSNSDYLMIINFMNERNEKNKDKEPFDSLLLIDLTKLMKGKSHYLYEDAPKFYYDPSFVPPAVFTNDFLPKECIINLIKVK